MQPTDGFWGGIGDSIGSSPGWMVVGALLVLGVIFLLAKYVVPSKERIKMRELGIREKEADNDSERIKTNAAMVEQMSALRESNVTIASQNAAMLGRFEESAGHSREMGGTVKDTNSTAHHIDETTRDTNTLVTEIHSIVVKGNQ